MMQIRRRFQTSPLVTLDLDYPIAAGNTPPQNILETIVWRKEQEVMQLWEQRSLSELLRQVSHSPTVRDFSAALRQHPTSPSLIAEVKKASPSKGVIRDDFDPVAIAQAYEAGGAACLSVLTDQTFFQGSFENLRRVRQQVSLPLLCKEFIIDPYQLYLARSVGADAVLLIAAILSNQDLRDLMQLAHSLGMQALVEVHTLDELDRVLPLLSAPHLIGINNRNLENFSVDLQTTARLIAARRSQLRQLDITIVSESGLHTPADLALADRAGAQAVLVGESLVKQRDVEQAVRSLLEPQRVAESLT